MLGDMSAIYQPVTDKHTLHGNGELICEYAASNDMIVSDRPCACISDKMCMLQGV
jgi:hypothetical protein